MRYVAIRSEGGLIPYDLLDKIASKDAAGQKPGDFGLAKGRRLTDEISRVWADAQSLWSNFKRRRESLGDRDPYGTSITRSWIGSLLGDVDMLGFDLKLQASAVVVNNSTYAISHRSGEGEDAIPVHIEGLKVDLDRRLHTKLRTSPQAMVQDFLNNGEEVLWGIVTNGLGLRILRDSSRTARPTYLEFDLESIFEGNRFNEFALLYRVCHRSRFPRPGQDPADCLLERYYQDSVEQGWLLLWRDVARATDERTCIATIAPLGPASVKCPAVGFSQDANAALLLGNLCSLVFDYIVRQKVGGISLSFFIFKQLPVLTPTQYREEDAQYISSRILELVYTARDLESFAKDLGYAGNPYSWNGDRRVQVRAELDAYYAHLYGITRDELRYILDPKEVFGQDFPSESFRVLKERENREHGEFRTQRLVLTAFDDLAISERFAGEMTNRESTIKVNNNSMVIGGS